MIVAAVGEEKVKDVTLSIGRCIAHTRYTADRYRAHQRLDEYVYSQLDHPLADSAYLQWSTNEPRHVISDNMAF